MASQPPPAVVPRRGLRGRTLLLIAAGLVVLLIVPTVLVPTVLFPPKPPKFTDDRALPDFDLTDHTGAAFTRTGLTGHVTIVNFIFTRCDNICPVTTMKMRTVMDRTGDQPDIKLVSFTVDPEHDSVPVLANYALANGADPQRWRFVRGDLKAIRDLVEQAMKIGFDTVGTLTSGAPDITHSGHFVLVDQRGHLRGFYDSDDWGRVETLMRHARWLSHHPPR
ncbi:MAG: SCO family protein [Myxococcales bacterium]|jgi:protein SCO1/2|nr:SCO family protein [Myxococcales bacterium]MBK7197980.1 SCO family protein [Myxococcales bacterium]MBP6845322.1 SCO family protein [Kofleriaceae bacterium]